MEDAKTILKLCISNTFIKQLSNVCRTSEITIPLREKKINIQFNKIVKELDYIKRYGNEKIILQKTILKNINDCFIENTYDYNNGVIETFNDYNESIFYQYAVNEEQLKEFINLCINENINYYAIDIEGDLSVLQIFYTYNKIYKVIIIDMIKIELSYIKDILINILKSEKYKFFYDCRNDFNILEKKLNISYEIFNNCIDLQKDNISMKEILEKSNINHYLKKDIKNIMNESNQRNVDIWLHRPIHRDLLIYSMLDAYCTYKIYEKNKLIDYKNLSHLVEFTRNKYEHYKYGKIIKDTNIIIDSDINSIINLLDIDEDLEDIREMIKISTDIFIDSNRYLSFNKHGKLTINKNIYITKNKIKNIIEKCDWEESEDNRYILEKLYIDYQKYFTIMTFLD